ncbi:unnamed protein product [Meloidogyne enterolobii]|uniref:Uncharacterized protein n=1 Tax=Meloidogyne enterolobii TaxID=390850 RepID=A0ACB0XWH4_MELEN
MIFRQVIQCWSQIPTPKKNSFEHEIVGCKSKFIDEVKDNPNMPIAKTTAIRRTLENISDKFDKIAKELIPGSLDWPTIVYVGKVYDQTETFSNDLDSLFDIVNSTLYEAKLKLKNEIAKAEKTNDEEDWIAVEMAAYEFIKTSTAAVFFDEEYQLAKNSYLTYLFKGRMVLKINGEGH